MEIYQHLSLSSSLITEPGKGDLTAPPMLSTTKAEGQTFKLTQSNKAEGGGGGDWGVGEE